MMMSRRHAVLLVFMWFSAVRSFAAGGPEADTSRVFRDSTFSLHEVVTTALRNQTPHQTMIRAQLKGIASGSIADALKYMAGVQVKDYGGLGGQKTVNVRSMGSQHVGVYIDGVRVTNAQNGTVDLGKYSLSTLESVSLFNANKTELLMMASEYASASTVYLATHRPDSSSFTAAYGVGSFNTHRVSATWSYKRLGFIDAQFTHSDGNYPFRYHTEYEDTTGVRRNGDIDQFRIEGAAFAGPLSVHTYYYMSQRGLPGGVVRRLTDKYTDVGREWDQNFFTQLTYRQRFGAFGIRAIAKYANDRLHYRSDYDENISVHANTRYHQQDAYSAVAASWIWRNVSVSASTDFRWSDLMSDMKFFRYVYRIDSKSSLSVFWRIRNLSLNATMLYTHVTDHRAGAAKPLNRVTWDALASYTLGRWTLRAFYKSVFRAPTLNDLYYTLVGNRNLRPEYTRQLDFGASYTASWLSFQADAYYNTITDRIVCLPGRGALQWTMLNYGSTRCLGVNAQATAVWRKHTLMLTGTFQDDRNRTDPAGGDYNDFIAYSPRWSFTAIYTFRWRGLAATVSDMFVGSRFWTLQNSLEPPLPAYNCTDIKVAYTWRRWTVEAECQNLFDKPYEMIVRWPMPGRRFMGTLRVDF